MDPDCSQRHLSNFVIWWDHWQVLARASDATGRKKLSFLLLLRTVCTIALRTVRWLHRKSVNVFFWKIKSVNVLIARKISRPICQKIKRHRFTCDISRLSCSNSYFARGLVGNQNSSIVKIYVIKARMSRFALMPIFYKFGMCIDGTGPNRFCTFQTYYLHGETKLL
jgi:hypothetical protein